MVALGDIRAGFLQFLFVDWSVMGDQSMTISKLKGITTTFTMALAALNEHMTNLTNKVNNAKKNGNRWRDKRGWIIRVSCGGNNHVIIAENSSSEEEEPDDKKIVDHGNRQYNHDYWVNIDIPLFYETIGVEEFLDWKTDIEIFFYIMRILENKKVKTTTIRPKSIDVF